MKEENLSLKQELKQAADSLSQANALNKQLEENNEALLGELREKEETLSELKHKHNKLFSSYAVRAHELEQASTLARGLESRAETLETQVRELQLELREKEAKHKRNESELLGAACKSLDERERALKETREWEARHKSEAEAHARALGDKDALLAAAEARIKQLQAELDAAREREAQLAQQRKDAEAQRALDATEKQQRNLPLHCYLGTDIRVWRKCVCVCVMFIWLFWVGLVKLVRTSPSFAPPLPAVAFLFLFTCFPSPPLPVASQTQHARGEAAELRARVRSLEDSLADARAQLSQLGSERAASKGAHEKLVETLYAQMSALRLSLAQQEQNVAQREAELSVAQTRAKELGAWCVVVSVSRFAFGLDL